MVVGCTGLVITAKDYESSFSQVWMLPYPDGQARKITNDLSDYGGMSLTADSRAMVVVQGQRLSNIWVAASGAARRPAQTTLGAGRYFDLSWTPDGHVLYASDASGSADLWEMNADGSEAKQLTSGAGRNYGPASSPDGRHVVFHTNRNGAWNIWRMDRDGSNPKQLTFDNEDNTWAQCSPDGQWVIYQHSASGSQVSVWKVPINGGAPVQLTDTASMRPAISPDGSMFACWYWNEQPDSPPRIALFPFGGGPPIKLFEIPPGLLLSWSAILQWAPDGRALTYVDNRSGVDNIWSQPIDGSKPVLLTDFKSDRIESFNWSRDGKLVCSRGVITNDVVLIRNDK
jgi:Tol biopolymer transport system component